MRPFYFSSGSFLQSLQSLSSSFALTMALFPRLIWWPRVACAAVNLLLLIKEVLSPVWCCLSVSVSSLLSPHTVPVFVSLPLPPQPLTQSFQTATLLFTAWLYHSLCLNPHPFCKFQAPTLKVRHNQYGKCCTLLRHRAVVHESSISC